MTDLFFKQLNEKSKNGKVFHYLENGEWKVCENIAYLPFNNETLGKYLTDKENAYKERIEALEKQTKKQEAIIMQLIEAIKTLNGGAK